MAGGSYQPLPTSDSPPLHFDHVPSPTSYPPAPITSKRVRSRHRAALFIGVKTALMVLGAVSLVHYLLLALLPNSAATTYRATLGLGTAFPSSVPNPEADLAALLQPGHSAPGTFTRDSTPGRTAAAFWALAEKEVAALGRDTCGDKLGRGLVDGYARSKTLYCSSSGYKFTLDTLSASTHTHWVPGAAVPADERAQRALCMPVHRDAASSWWPFPAAPCVSTNLCPGRRDGKWTGDGVNVSAGQCAVTTDGEALRGEMGRETFLGSVIEESTDAVECTARIEHTVMLIHRQDEWNPFHVAEDLITTLVTLLIAQAAVPEIVHERLQLVFTDEYSMDANHFTALYDRMGDWAPRRLSLDPWDEGTCFTNAIHSVGAGASLLSAMGVSRSDRCTSTITWAASHYYRHLFGLLPRVHVDTDVAAATTSATSSNADIPAPPSLADIDRRASSPARTEPINVLWLSRSKLEAYALKHHDWSSWREYRRLENEPAVLARLRRGFAELCAPGATSPAFPHGCIYEDAQDVPEAWGRTNPAGEGEPVRLRFAAIDPTVHALETQVHYLGHTSLLMGQHGGAMGLALFMPPGEGAVLELQVPSVNGNYHFEHLAYQTGHAYLVAEIEVKIDVERLWTVVKGQVEEEAKRVYV